MEGNPIDHSQVTSLETSELTGEKIAFIYSGLLKLMQKAMRAPVGSLKQEVSESFFRLPETLKSIQYFKFRLLLP